MDTVEIPKEDLELFLVDFDYSTGKCLDQYNRHTEPCDRMYGILLKRISLLQRYEGRYTPTRNWTKIRDELVRRKLVVVP